MFCMASLAQWMLPLLVKLFLSGKKEIKDFPELFFFCPLEDKKINK